jgi:hypothetical protein
LQFIEPLTLAAPPQQRSHMSETNIRHWMSSYLGISIDLIVSQVDGRNVHNIIVRCPLSSSKVLKSKIQTSWAPWPSLWMYPFIRIQNVIPSTSSIVEACQQGDTMRIKELMSSGNAHPNDTTADKKTLLHVCQVRIGC